MATRSAQAPISVLGKRWLLYSIVCHATLALVAIAQGAEIPRVASPQLLLKLATHTASGAPESGKSAGWLDAGIKCELLTSHGRLLPDDLAQEEKNQLAVALLDSDAASSPSVDRLLERFSLADRLDFDGQHYGGGNLGFIDSVLGKSRRPIAFDREVPMRLVPLAPEAEAGLIEKRTSFLANPGVLELCEAANQAYGEGASSQMLADGQFLRAYAGRFDDLYFHLFQNGNGVSALAFCALVDGLGERTYRPLAGVCPRDSAPAARFDLDDILSGGGKSAVARHLRDQSVEAGTPFQRFAFRVVPSLAARARTLPAGARLTASPEEIAAALQSRRFLYPTQVPALYRSPDRFLGWAGSLFMPVANRPAVPSSAADSWYPLPQRDAPLPAEQGAERAASAQLFKSSSTADIVWEDPQFSNLLADPEVTETRPKAAKRGPALPKLVLPEITPAEPLAPEPAPPKVEADPRKRITNARLVAIVTPTMEEAKAYSLSIAASDETLRAIEQTRGRVRLLREFIESARAAAGEAALQETITSDLGTLETRERELAQRLSAALQERANVRAELEDRLRERAASLQSLGKTAAREEGKLRL